MEVEVRLCTWSQTRPHPGSAEGKSEIPNRERLWWGPGLFL